MSYVITPALLYILCQWRCHVVLPEIWFEVIEWQLCGRMFLIKPSPLCFQMCANCPRERQSIYKRWSDVTVISDLYVVGHRDRPRTRPHCDANLSHYSNRTESVGLKKCTYGAKTGGCAPFLGELGPHLAQCGLGRGLPPYQVASWSIQAFGHNRYWAENWGLCPFGGAGSPSNTMWPLARAEAYLHVKFHVDPSNRLATIHQRYRQDKQAGQTTVW